MNTVRDVQDSRGDSIVFVKAYKEAMFTDWFNKLSVIFEGYRGLVSFAVFVGGLFVLEMFTKVLDGGTAFIVYAFFLAFMISWVYFATGQHNKPKV